MKKKFNFIRDDLGSPSVTLASLGVPLGHLGMSTSVHENEKKITEKKKKKKI